jgi:hypothetical protein
MKHNQSNRGGEREKEAGEGLGSALNLAWRESILRSKKRNSLFTYPTIC